jgi:hypothetical protein
MAEQKLLVWGDPVSGFTYMGPMTPNDPAMETWIETNLSDEYWWYVPLKPPAWGSKGPVCPTCGTDEWKFLVNDDAVCVEGHRWTVPVEDE